ncbi:DUF3833 family protein [Oceanomicrobium pacificus]
MSMALVILALLLLGGLYFFVAQRMGFRAQRIDDYAEAGPSLDIREALNGRLTADGVIYDYSGRVASRFTADITGTWDGNSGRLDETFHYDSGKVQTRYWLLDLDASGNIVARAPDVKGDGTGVQKGSAVQMRYRLQLPDDVGGHVLDTVDWMYMLQNGTIVNRSEMRKFGIKVAELIATFRKVG